MDTLRAAKVLGRGEREQQIRKALDAATRTVPGARWREDKNLLDTVVNLTEWPVGNSWAASIASSWNCRKKSWSPSCVTIRNILPSKMPPASCCRIFWQC